MIEEVYARYCAIEDKLEDDWELRHLRQQLYEKTSALGQVLCQLTPAQCSVICEYLDVCAEIDQRIVEIACFCDK